MVAASKMRSAQVNTENSRGIVQPLVRLLGDLPAAEGTKNVFVPITSDKGLCGGINTTVCKCALGQGRAAGCSGAGRSGAG